MKDIADRVREFVTTNFYVDAASLENDSSLLERGVIDSTGVLELVAFLERDFGVEVHDEELLPENLDTIGSITAYITRKNGA